MATWRSQQARLEAALIANQALQEFGQADAAWVDVFEAINRAGAVLMFRPLKNLYGAFVSRQVTGTVPGIIIHAGHPMALQRFTAAHELGHLVMGHQVRVDTKTTILGRQSASAKSFDRNEFMADVFAANFLMPFDRVEWAIRRLALDSADLRQPRAVYRLSLLFGVTYSAMTHHLAALDLIPDNAVEALKNRPPQFVKQALLGEMLSDPWSDVWDLTQEQSGQTIVARAGDHIVITLENHATGGYIWEVDHATNTPVDTIKKGSPQLADPRDPKLFGATIPQTFHVQIGDRSSATIAFRHHRPWDHSPDIEHFTVHITVVNKPRIGLAEQQRPRAA